MDWIKVPTDNVLYSEYKDSELIVLIKYQALYCQLEVEPSDMQLKRVFNKKQQDFLRSNAEVVQKLIKSQIKVVTTKRNRDKDNYQRKQQLNENSASGKFTESLRTCAAEKIREDKSKKDTKVSTKEIDDAFNSFYSQYPLKKSKQAASKAWVKLSPEQMQKCLDVVESDQFKTAMECQNTRRGDFRKHPSTWLNQGCWDDDLSDHQTLFNNQTVGEPF